MRKVFAPVSVPGHFFAAAHRYQVCHALGVCLGAVGLRACAPARRSGYEVSLLLMRLTKDVPSLAFTG
jgi:hypothetical protein